MTPGIFPSRRMRRVAREPSSRPTLAAKVTSAMTDLLKMMQSECSDGHRASGGRPTSVAARSGGPPAGALGQVVAPEEFGDRGVLEHGVNGFGEDGGHREDLQLVEIAVLGHRQGV